MLVYFTISLAVLLGCCGMAIDVGRMELRTTQLQAAADDAALTASAEIQRNNISTVTTKVSSEVSTFMTQAGLPAATAAFQFYSSMAPYTADLSTFQVTVTQTLPLYFMALVGKTSASLSARAVAMVPPCVYFRDNTINPPSANGRLASARITTGCPIYSVRNFGIDYFSYIQNYQLKVTGTSAQSGSSGGATSPPIYNAPVLADPLAYLTAPVFSSCTYTGQTYSVSTTISPGTYCGGISITGGTVTMNPGLYIITGGVSITNSSTLTGTGVTLYLTQGGGSSFGQFKIYNSTFTVSAPTTSSAGGIPGIVIFLDRNWNNGQFDLIFNSDTYQADGIIYATNTGLTLSGTNMYSGGHYLGIDVASYYQYLGNLDPACDYSVLPGGNPFHMPVRLLQ